jgi:hypothetical protein
MSGDVHRMSKSVANETTQNASFFFATCMTHLAVINHRKAWVRRECINKVIQSLLCIEWYKHYATTPLNPGIFPDQTLIYDLLCLTINKLVFSYVKKRTKNTNIYFRARTISFYYKLCL